MIRVREETQRTNKHVINGATFSQSAPKSDRWVDASLRQMMIQITPTTFVWLSTLSASKLPKLESKPYLDVLDRQVIIKQTVCTFTVACCCCWLREPWPLARKLPGHSFLHYHWSASATNYSSQSRVNGYRTWQESAIRPEERKGNTLPEERTNEPRFQNVIKIAASQRYIATHCVRRSVHGQREGEVAGC